MKYDSTQNDFHITEPASSDYHSELKLSSASGEVEDGQSCPYTRPWLVYLILHHYRSE